MSVLLLSPKSCYLARVISNLLSLLVFLLKFNFHVLAVQFRIIISLLNSIAHVSFCLCFNSTIFCIVSSFCITIKIIISNTLITLIFSLFSFTNPFSYLIVLIWHSYERFICQHLFDFYLSVFCIERNFNCTKEFKQGQVRTRDVLRIREKK